MKGWGSFKIKRGLTLCYSCIRMRHLDKECLDRRPSCLCCKAMDHEVLDCPKMNVNLDRMNMGPEDPKKGQDTEIMEEPQKKSEDVFLQTKEALNDH
jgi:hypothetical protein